MTCRDAGDKILREKSYKCIYTVNHIRSSWEFSEHTSSQASPPIKSEFVRVGSAQDGVLFFFKLPR